MCTEPGDDTGVVISTVVTSTTDVRAEDGARLAQGVEGRGEGEARSARTAWMARRGCSGLQEHPVDPITGPPVGIVRPCVQSFTDLIQ